VRACILGFEISFSYTFKAVFCLAGYGFAAWKQWILAQAERIERWIAEMIKGDACTTTRLCDI